MTIQPPLLGTVFGNFFVEELFQRFFMEVAARVKRKAGRYITAADRQSLDDALWLTEGNAAAAARLTGYKASTVLRYKKEPLSPRRKVFMTTPAQCAAAYRKHGTWRAAQKALGIGYDTFARRLREYDKMSSQQHAE